MNPNPGLGEVDASFSGHSARGRGRGAAPAHRPPMRRKRSTNPFDDDYEDDDFVGAGGAVVDEDDASAGEDDDVFHECLQDDDIAEERNGHASAAAATGTTRKLRSAPLNFDLPTEVERPSLRFDGDEFQSKHDPNYISPLESALIKADRGLMSPIHDDDEEDEDDLEDDDDDDGDEHDAEEDERDGTGPQYLTTVSSFLPGGLVGEGGTGSVFSKLLHGAIWGSGGGASTNEPDAKPKSSQQQQQSNGARILSRASSAVSFLSAISEGNDDEGETDDPMMDRDLFPDIALGEPPPPPPGARSTTDENRNPFDSERARLLDTSFGGVAGYAARGLTPAVLSERDGAGGAAGNSLHAVNSSSSSLSRYSSSDRSLGQRGGGNRSRSAVGGKKEKRRRNKASLSVKGGGGGGGSSRSLASSNANEGSIVLNKIVSSPKDSEFTMDYRSPGTPWTKVIILEELGTASSWILLLLPYAAFVLALALDYADSGLKLTTLRNLGGSQLCTSLHASALNNGNSSAPMALYGQATTVFAGGRSGYSIPLTPSPLGCCSYPYTLHEGVGLLSYGKRNHAIVDKSYRHLMSKGVAFTSGPISNVPTMSNFLFGDAMFNGLSSDAVALVAKGSVLSSAVVFQRRRKEVTEVGRNESGSVGNAIGADEEWFPVSISKPKRLSMVCKLNRARKHHKTSEGGDPVWDCSSPRIVDVLFSLPNTVVLTGGQIRVEILYTYYNAHPTPSDDVWSPGAQFDYRYDDDDDDRNFGKGGRFHDAASEVDEYLSAADISDPLKLLSELSASSSYAIQHERQSYASLVVGIRLTTLVLTIGFGTYWFWSMGLKGFCCWFDEHSGDRNEGGCCCGFPRFLCWRKKVNGEDSPVKRKRRGIAWWESPWITFPERRYLLLLLICLLFVQNPLLAYMYFHPDLYSSSKAHVAADSIMGIGIHGILFLWLCLMQGMRYHTASFARKRAHQQRQVLELRRAANYLSREDHSHYGATDHESTLTTTYYDQYGDVDGTGAVGAMSLRLTHDPCGVNWADFLLPKIFLLVIGACSVITSAVSRFPASIGNHGDTKSTFDANAEALNPYKSSRFSEIYISSSFAQLVVLILWGLLIIRNALTTASRLKKEPFLSTRPAQLAFRVLTGILCLAVGAVLLPFTMDLFVLIKKWTVGSTHTLRQKGQVSEKDVVYNTSSGFHGAARHSTLELLLKIIIHTTKRFPYSGTAASIGPGKLIYVTVCSVVAAFIFLPSSYFYESDNEQFKRKLTRRKMMTRSTKHSTLSLVDRQRQRKDKRLVVTLARYTHTWRIFPLPIKRQPLLSRQSIKAKLGSVGTFQVDGNFRQHVTKFGRGAIYKGKYMPVFCIEIACWLLEVSWQSYYSATEYLTNGWAPGRMNLESVGLKLERVVNDKATDTQAFISSNKSEQVDGEEDSIIVVAFRGTASLSNMRTDMRMRQVPLPETITGVGDQAAFVMRLGSSGTDVIGDDAWDLSASSSSSSPFLHTSNNGDNRTTLEVEDLHLMSIPAAVSSGAKAVIRATPMARQALPCVHEGFLEAYSHVRKKIVQTVLEVLRRQMDKAIERSRRGNIDNGSSSTSGPKPVLTLPKIYITGHSLGGCLGQLLALDLASNCELIIEQPCATSESSHTEGGGFEVKASFMDSSVNDDMEAVDSKQESGTTARRKSFPPRSTSKSDKHDHNGADNAEDVTEFWIGHGMTNKPRSVKTIRLQPPIAVYSFGQPRVGNFAFARLYKQRVPHTFRVVNEGDAFTTMPTPVCCGGFYKQAGLDVVLDEGCTGNTLVGPTVVETLFRFSKVRTSVAAHSMERYRDCLESALSQDELNEYYQGHGRKIESAARSQSLPEWVTKVKRSLDI